MFWRDAIEKLHCDKEINRGHFVAIIRPPKNAQKLGFTELLNQFENIEKTAVVTYGTRDFDRLIYTLKNHKKIDKTAL